MDDFLLSLFRDEVTRGVQTLCEGLVALEQDSDNLQQIEPLMRAAHSIKGAARIVAVELAVQVAHAMEDCLVAAQHGELKLSSKAIDVLLAGADWLTQIAAAQGPEFAGWVVQQQAGIDEQLARLHEVREGRLVETDTTPPEESIVPAPLIAPAASHEPLPAAPEPAEKVKPAASPTVPRAETAQSVVRVAADSLNRLLGLAGESLVEARWLQPFAKSLVNLRRDQDRVVDLLEEFARSLSLQGATPGALSTIDDLRRQLLDCRHQLVDRIEAFENHGRVSDDLNSRLYNEIIASRMRPMGDSTHGYPRLVRDLARELGKQARLEISGEETAVDRDVLERLDAPLNHLLRNAVDHGIESPEERRAAGKPEIARIRLSARHSAGMLVIRVSDDGRGIDIERIRAKVVGRALTTPELALRMSESELLEFLFLPGFSTREQVTQVSGRGVGLDVVHTTVQSLQGSMRIESQMGQGTTFHLLLPITLSVIRAVLVEIGGETYAFPHNRIDRLLRLPRADLHSLEHRHYFTLDERHVGVAMARQLLRLETETAHDELPLVVFSSHSEEYALVVDKFLGEQDLVVRPLDPRLGKVPSISAAAVLDDGSPVLIIDLDDVRVSITRLLETGRLERTDTHTAKQASRSGKRVLVVDDSITVREVERQLLSTRGYEVAVAVDGVDGWDAIRTGRFDLVVTDIDMPRMNGLDFTRRIKQDERLQSIPVVVVSYKERESDRLSGLEAGANYYLTKSSFHDDSLLEVVEDLIGAP